MSQFDLPRINFHGTALLDTPTANNGNYEPSLTLFDQNESEPFLPPRCYLPPNYTYQPPPGVQILQDNNGLYYVPISAITADNYAQWATTPLGSLQADQIYWSLYAYLKYGSAQLPLTGVNPGYWNYYGDLSMSLVNTRVTGISLNDTSGNLVTYTPQEQLGCPADLAGLFGAEFSFNYNYFSEGSQTSAYLCDVDSIGQMCTQIFAGQAGLYNTDAFGNQITYFIGTPVKSTARWMNLTKVLNYADGSILPMGGSVCFYAMMKTDESEFSRMVQQYTGKTVVGLFLKLHIHEVHEIREPDYSNVLKKNITDLTGNQIGVPKNPATVGVTGSITPWYEGDMKTTSIQRLLINTSTVTINTNGITPPVTKSHKTLSVPGSVNLGPVPFYHNPGLSLLSLDIINFINEYGSQPGTLAPYAGSDDIPAFQNFSTFNFGTFTLMFQPDAGGTPQIIGSFNYENDYNMQKLLSTGGMVDISVTPGADFSKGYFYLLLNQINISTEAYIFITSDQMGNYAQQNQSGNTYLSDGYPPVPCVLRVFFRGNPILQSSPVAITMQAINIRTGAITNTPNMSVYDGMNMNFPVGADGCLTYAFIDSQSTLLQNDFSNLFTFIMNNSLIVVRTLSAEQDLDEYLSGSSPITWDVVYKYVFRLFKVLYPVMDAVIPFTQSNWSDPFILNKMLVLMDDSNWNKPLYMPLTRDLSAPQQQLLRMWANQIINPALNS